ARPRRARRPTRGSAAPAAPPCCRGQRGARRPDPRPRRPPARAPRGAPRPRSPLHTPCPCRIIVAMAWCRRGTVAAAAALAAAAAVAGPCSAATLFLVQGGGWGHGVGMSQWGAEGYALHGWNDRQILAHYYPHTVFGNEPSRSLRVLVGEQKS